MTTTPTEGPLPKLSRSHITTAVAVAAAALGGTAIADAASSSSSGASSTQRPGDGAREEPLTGATADKVKAAALARVGGSVLRVETDQGGVYEAHVRKADGTDVEVAVDNDFRVTDVQEHGPDGRGAPGGHQDLSAVASKLGVNEAKLTAAVDAARPVRRSPFGREDRAAALAKALGVESSAIRTILDANRPTRPALGTRPDQSALVTALAKGLSIDEAKVRTALARAESEHRAGHDAERTAMYATVAKAVGKSPAEVKAAFEAARPTKHTP
jgi:hypothetical protein